MKVTTKTKIQQSPIKRKHEKWDRVALLFIAPYMVFLIMFMVYPTFMALAGSVADWNILTSDLDWVGFKNYAGLFKDPEFYQAIKNSFVYLVVQIPLSIIGGILVALVLNSQIHFRGFFRGIYYLPVITGAVVLSIVWSWLYDSNTGVFNYVLNSIGLPKIPWLTDPRYSMISISLMKVWTDIGFYAVIFLAALQGMPNELLEAAKIDGASRWRQLWNIKLPLLNPTIVFSVIMGTIWGMQIFTEPYNMTEGGPLGSSMTLTLFLYRQGFIHSRMGYASAIGVTTAVLILCFTLLERRIFEKDVY